jgi:hypothetical protein
MDLQWFKFLNVLFKLLNEIGEYKPFGGVSRVKKKKSEKKNGVKTRGNVMVSPFEFLGVPWSDM